MKNTQSKGKIRMETNMDTKPEALALVMTTLINSNKQEIFADNIPESGIVLLESILDNIQQVNNIDDEVMNEFDGIAQTFIDIYQASLPDEDGLKHSITEREDGTYDLFIETVGSVGVILEKPNECMPISHDVHVIVAFHHLQEKYNFEFSNYDLSEESVFEAVKTIQAMEDLKDAVLSLLDNPDSYPTLVRFSPDMFSVLAFDKGGSLEAGLSTVITFGIEVKNIELLYRRANWLKNNEVDELTFLEEIAQMEDEVNVFVSELAILHEYDGEAKR